MNKKSTQTEKKYFDLKQLLVDGKIDLFEIEVSKLQLDELFEFSYSAYKNYEEKGFIDDYYGIKILGEFTYLVSAKPLIILSPNKFDKEEFGEMIFKGLGYAAHKSFDLGYYQDAEKYAIQVIKYPDISKSDNLSFLSNLAICAHNKGDVQKELFYCEKMLEVDEHNPKIYVNYAYALMQNKQYEKSKLYLEKCFDLNYKEFPVYNQLAVVYLYGYRDFEAAYSNLEQIYNLSNQGSNLNDRNRYLLFHNSLTISGISGNEKLLKHIIDFKNSINAINDQKVSNQWGELAEICETVNIGIFELENGQFNKAQQCFSKIKKYKWKGQIVHLAEFLNEICFVIQEHEKIQQISDVELLLNYVSQLDVIELFQDYKEIIKEYFLVLLSFMLLLENENDKIDLKEKKDRLKKYRSINLTTSDFINRSFNLIELIEEYKKDYSTTILKERVKQDYKEKLNLLTRSRFNIKNETTFLYSLNSVGNINMALFQLIVKIINLIQKNEPSFIKNYKKGRDTSLLETDFRDIFYRSFGMSYDIKISAEALSRVGHTDLQIESDKFGTKTFEFKIWGSNDYKDVVKQIYEYLTDLEKDGFVFMVNKNKKGIKKEYVNNLKREEMGYISNSYELNTIDNFEYIVSKHKIHNETKTIYHFIYNIF